MFELSTLHPVFVHFTVALLLASTILLVIGVVIKKHNYSDYMLKTGYLNLWIGAVITVITVIFGFYEYSTIAHDTPSHIAMKDHRNWALVTFASFIILAAYSYFKRNNKPKPVFLMFLITASILLIITGHKGILLVYKYGLAVETIPNTNGHNHSTHDHNINIEKKNNMDVPNPYTNTNTNTNTNVMENNSHHHNENHDDGHHH